MDDGGSLAGKLSSMVLSRLSSWAWSCRLGPGFSDFFGGDSGLLMVAAYQEDSQNLDEAGSELVN